MAPRSLRSPEQRLFAEHMPMADNIARRWAMTYAGLLEVDDAQQIARLALWRAIPRIKDQATAVAYLASCIRGDIRHWLRDRALMVRLPKSAPKDTPWRHTSLSTPVADGQITLEDTIPAPPTPEPPNSEVVEALLDRLPAHQAAVLRLRVLQNLSGRAAARELAISNMTVSRWEKAALDALRPHVDHLRP